jgi:predicted aconitase with swiveling domain
VGTAAVITGRTLTPGRATGQCLVLSTPLSFWGGTDDQCRVTDVRHPQFGASLSGRVVVMGTGRGSSSSASVLAEQIRTQVAPAAIILSEVDAVLVAGALVAQELYGLALPIVVVERAELSRLTDGLDIRVLAETSACVIDLAP